MSIGEIMAIHRFHGITSMIDKYLTISSLLTFLVRFLNEEYRHFTEYQILSDHKDSATLTQAL